jgi:hypothetical protein
MFIVNIEGAIFKEEKWLVIERSLKEEHAGGTLSLVGGKWMLKGIRSERNSISQNPDEVEDIYWMSCDEIISHPKVTPWLIESIKRAEKQRVVTQ